MNTYITLKGDVKMMIGGKSVEWDDQYGHHCGTVVKFGTTCDQSGSDITQQKHVFTIDCGDDGIREVNPSIIRDFFQAKARYSVIDRRVDGIGDEFCDEGTLEFCLKRAESDWNHLTSSEKSKREIIVGVSFADEEGSFDFCNFNIIKAYKNERA